MRSTCKSDARASHFGRYIRFRQSFYITHNTTKYYYLFLHTIHVSANVANKRMWQFDANPRVGQTTMWKMKDFVVYQNNSRNYAKLMRHRHQRLIERKFMCSTDGIGRAVPCHSSSFVCSLSHCGHWTASRFAQIVMRVFNVPNNVIDNTHVQCGIKNKTIHIKCQWISLNVYLRWRWVRISCEMKR